jgi:uncharacterized repeat protein (TIGR03803 family)
MKSILLTVSPVTYPTTLRSCRRRSSVTCCAVLCLLASAYSQSNPGTYEVLHAFTGSPDGGQPTAGLVRDAQGNFYGTTSGGGASSATCNNNYCGVVFKIDSAGNETVLYGFKGQPDGANPLAGLIQDAAGNLYGTTSGGGASNNGTIFKLDSSGNETVLYSFGGQPDGSSPQTVLVQDAAGNLYGTTKLGGVSNTGTIFKLDTSGAETVLYSFTANADGKFPQDLLRDSTGNLYGAANRGGVRNCNTELGAIACGTIFKLNTMGTLTVLYSFQGSNPSNDGGRPVGRLVADAVGNLYGTTEYGGSGGCTIDFPNTQNRIGCGTVFKLDTAGSETLLHSFTGADGSFPLAGLLIDPQGNLYGTTSSNVFELDTSGSLTVLYDFTGGANGGNPEALLLRDAAGNLYGTATTGGNSNCVSGCGLVFDLPATTSPVFNVSVTFSGLGTGRVSSSPSGINCPPDCLSAFPVGTTVTLTANPSTDSTFGGWSGNCSTANNNVCTVNSTQALGAVFSLPPRPDFAVSASALTPAAVSPGSASSSTITTTATGGFSGSITLSCSVQSSVALSPTCSVSPATVDVGANAVLTVSTTGPMASAVSPSGSRFLYATWLPVLGMLLGGTSLIRRNRTHKLRLRLACLLVAGALFQTACGGSTKVGSPGTPAGTYTIVVTATSGSLQHSVNPNPTLTVQ